MKKYPYPPFEPREEIDLIRFVASVLFPGNPCKPVHNKVRQAIRYAQKTGKLPTPYSISEFFTWACMQWPELPEKADGFPRRYSSALIGSHRIEPPIPEDLRDGYLALWYENQTLKADLKRALDEVKRLRLALINAKRGRRT